jgi:NADPH:quinone reductase-like Zn-dependent oxidoreductase
VRFDRYGPVDVLDVVDVPEPTVDEGQVVVRVVTSGINPGEIAVREGAMRERWPATFPSGQGSDFAGRVRLLGPDVTEWAHGDEVIGWTDERAAQAEYVTVPVDHLTRRPPKVPWDQAGALPIAGCTAHAAVDAVAARAGQTVLVAGASGGVGSIVVQLLRNLGARVLAVAGPGNAEWLESIGVEAVTYGDGLQARVRDAAPDGIDAVIDAHGDGYVELALALGVDPQRIDTIIDFAAAEQHGTQTAGSQEGLSPGVLAELGESIAAGDLVVPIAARYPLDKLRDAYTELARGHTRGKIVLDVTAA